MVLVEAAADGILILVELLRGLTLARGRVDFLLRPSRGIDLLVIQLLLHGDGVLRAATACVSDLLRAAPMVSRTLWIVDVQRL